MICQDVFPGRRHSQKIHPFVGLRVIAKAAADGESNRRPFTTRNPDLTLPL